MEEENLSIIDVREIGLKCSTKSEVYKVLTITGGVYLPPVQQINSEFIREVLCGQKLFIATSQVKIINVPHIEEYAREHCNIDKYIPESDFEKYPSRKWICNVINSLIPDQFKQFVNKKILECNGKTDEKKGNKFPILSTMAKMFKDTTLVSKRHGKFHQLIKRSKVNRRERDEKANEEMKERELSNYIDRQKDEIEDLKAELNECKSRLEEREKDTELLQNLYSNGYIDIDGNPIDKNS